jgi:hypothetical protein
MVPRTWSVGTGPLFAAHLCTWHVVAVTENEDWVKKYCIETRHYQRAKRNVQVSYYRVSRGSVEVLLSRCNIRSVTS